MDPIKDIKKLAKKGLRPGGSPTRRGKKRVEFRLRINLWKVLIAFFLILFFAPFLVSVLEFQRTETKLDTSQALLDIKEGKVKEVLVQDSKLILTYKDDATKVTTKEGSESFAELLEKSEISPTSITYTVADQSLTKAVGEVLGILLPLILMAVFFFFIIRAQTKGAQDIFSFGRSRAKLFAKGKQDVTFDDVAGVDDAKKELEEIVDFLKNPAKYRKIGARTPKGVLLVGPAGVGKCITGDSLVWTSKGLIEIKDVPKYFAVEDSGYVHGASLASFDPEIPIQTTAQSSHWYDLGVSETIKLQTELGHQIEGTPEHPLVVMDKNGKLKFAKLENINKGDSIAIKTNDQMFGNYRLLDAKTSYLLGLLAGDGGLT